MEQDNDASFSGREAVVKLLEENLSDLEETAQAAERSTGGLPDIAKKAGSFQKVRQHENEQRQGKGLLDKAKDKLLG